MLELFFMPEAVVGCVVGLLLAGLIHWLAPAPEPVLLEAALVALGFIGGLAVGYIAAKRDDERRRTRE